MEVPQRAWHATAAYRRAVLVAGLLALTGVLFGRPDVVLLGAPLAIGAAWALRRPPRERPVATLACHPGSVVEGGSFAVTVTAANPGEVGHDVVVLRTGVPFWLALSEPDRPRAVPVPAGQLAELSLAGTAERWGRYHIGPAVVRAYAADGLLCSDAAVPDLVPVAVYPATGASRPAGAVPRAAGLAGAHRSRQPGPGGELAGVRRYAAGDRLRRLDWRVSLRTREPHVAATMSDRDAELVLVLDVFADAGEPAGPAGPGSVLDATVRAAASIAEHYLHRGDRVATIEYGHAARRLRPASGRRQYLTVLEWLLDLDVGRPDVPYGRLFGPLALPPDALIVVLSPLIEPDVTSMLARLARSGRYVVAVDTLPPGLPAPALGPHSSLAYRLWRLERENLTGSLREHGVPVVAWSGAHSLDRVLRDVTRLAAAPRVTVPGVGR